MGRRDRSGRLPVGRIGQRRDRRTASATQEVAELDGREDDQVNSDPRLCRKPDYDADRRPPDADRRPPDSLRSRPDQARRRTGQRQKPHQPVSVKRSKFRLSLTFCFF